LHTLFRKQRQGYYQQKNSQISKQEFFKAQNQSVAIVMRRIRPDSPMRSGERYWKTKIIQRWRGSSGNDRLSHRYTSFFCRKYSNNYPRTSVIKDIGNPDRKFPGIGAVSNLNSRSGILKASGLLKFFLQNFDKIQQNSPYLLL